MATNFYFYRGHVIEMQEDDIPVDETDETLVAVQEVKSNSKKSNVKSVKKSGEMPVMYLTPDDARYETSA